MVDNKVNRKKNKVNRKKYGTYFTFAETEIIKSRANNGIYYKRLFNKSREVDNRFMGTLICVQLLTMPFIFFFPKDYIFIGINLGCMIGVLLNVFFYLLDFSPFWNREMQRRWK